MFILIILAVIALVAVAATVAQIVRDGYARVADRPELFRQTPRDLIPGTGFAQH